MSEEPNNKKSSTSINDLVEEVERLLREVEEKEESEQLETKKETELADELKDILEAPTKRNSRRKKVEPIIEYKDETEKLEEEIEIKIQEPKRGRGRPKKIVPVEEKITIEETVIEKPKEVSKYQEEKNEETIAKHVEEQSENDVKKEVEIEKKVVIEKEIVKDKNSEFVEKEVSRELITIKGESKELTITKEQLNKIEEEIKKQKDIPKQERNIINKKIFKFIMIAVFIVIYFISINLGFMKLKEETFLNDVRVFSGILIIATVVIFEKAYKKESKELTILGLESLALSLVTLFINYFYLEHIDRFPYIINACSMLFATYYVGKSIITYVKMKKAAMKKFSDIRNIINRSK